MQAGVVLEASLDTLLGTFTGSKSRRRLHGKGTRLPMSATEEVEIADDGSGEESAYERLLETQAPRLQTVFCHVGRCDSRDYVTLLRSTQVNFDMATDGGIFQIIISRDERMLGIEHWSRCLM